MLFFVLLGERVVDRRESINSSVHDDVAKVFRGKTYSQLIALEKQIHQKITSGDAVDIGNLILQLKPPPSSFIYLC